MSNQSILGIVVISVVIIAVIIAIILNRNIRVIFPKIFSIEAEGRRNVKSTASITGNRSIIIQKGAHDADSIENEATINGDDSSIIH